MTTYAIGDIHGSLDKLNDLLPRLEKRAQLVFLGDYLDKGPSSKGVVDAVRSLTDAGRASSLLGNHEFLWLDHISGADRSQLLMRTGAADTFKSYLGRNIDADECAARFTDRAGLALMFGPDYEFMKSLKSHFVPADTRAVCVHGGITPDFGDSDLAEHDLEKLVFLRFGRNASDRAWRGRVVVVGHTVVGSCPSVAGDTICIDTGAWMVDGRLTALDLESFTFVQDDGTVGHVAIEEHAAA